MVKRLNPGIIVRIFFPVILVQLFLCHLWGLDPYKAIDRYLVDQWDMLDGLPSNTVRSIAQTPDGYLWIGTSKGLVRYDGIKFEIVRFPGKEENYSKDIRRIFVDRKGAIWIGSAVGLTLRRFPGDRFKMFTAADGIAVEGIRHIYEDMKGNTWISFDAGYVTRFSNGKFTSFNPSHGLSGKKINAILEDHQGNLLFGTRENGIFSFSDGKFFKYPAPDLDGGTLITMMEDRAGNLWIGADNGLFKVNRSNGKWITTRYTTGNGLSDDFVISILEDSERNLWVGTQRGLNRVKRIQDGSMVIENLLNTTPIYYLFEDREKSLWIGSDVAGMKRLKDGKFMPYALFQERKDDIPLSLFEDREGNTWIGTADGKLFQCRDGAITASFVPVELSGTGIASIAQDAEGNLWLGTTGKGVFQKKNNRFIPFTTRQGLSDNVVTSILRDSRDNLWFGTFDGVSVLRSSDGIIETFNSRDGLAGKVVHNVYETSTGEIRIAADKGITVLPNVFAGGLYPSQAQGTIFSKKAPWPPKIILPGISATCIYEDLSTSGPGNSIYWIATDGAGLKRLSDKDGKITSYTVAQGMTTNFIYQFFEDFGGNFWLMSDSGILRVGKSELASFVDSGANKINCTYFGIADGLESLEFDNKFSRNSALKAGDGEFRFITKKGITCLKPGDIRINQMPPTVVMESVYFNRRRVSLPPGMKPAIFKGITDISFNFTAPTFLSPEKANFKYRLEGVDTSWIFVPPGRGRSAHYTELPPGTYTFRVTASNADGVWNQEGDSRTFTLKLFFHQTLLFKLAALFLFSVLAAVVFYIYRKRKPPVEKQEKYKDSDLDPRFAEECITKLNLLMEKEKIYCDPAISLQSLAAKMSMSPHQLSRVLNEKLDRNFSDFINWHRVEESKKILQGHRGQSLKISAIALEVGFGTMAAFYKAFKKHTGKTPTWYQKKS